MEDTTSGQDPSNILLMSKIGAMVGLGFGSLALGTLPLVVGRYRARKQLRQKRHQKRRQAMSSNSSTSTSTSTSDASSPHVDSASAANKQGLLTSLLLCFGGGVLLFTTFIHLAPEVRASVETHQSNKQLPDLGSLGLAELLFCGGFFLVYLVEEAVHAALTGKPESSEALLYRTVSVRRCNNNQTGPSSSSVISNGSITTVSTTTKSTAWKNTNDAEDSKDPANRLKLQLDDSRDQAGKDDKALPPIFVLPVALSNEEHKVVRRHSDLELAIPELNYSINHHHSHDHHHQHGAMQNTSIQGLLTVLALSFHAIFEGLAVGLEPSISSVAYLAAAIATHKLVIAFCVGMELYVAGASTKTTLGYLLIFAMVTPIGIAVGLVLAHFKNDSENLGPTPTILQGMAAGTLLYVVFFEVLARERANEKSGLLQLVAIIVGFTLMLGLQIATAHSHSHDSSGHGHSHGGHGHSHDCHGNSPNHTEIEEEHDHDHDHNHDVVTGMIDKVTDSIAEVLTNALSSSTTPSTTVQRNNINETSPLHPQRS
ncbi:PREDICTED: protein zntB-like isoform X1 [Trachymyrmex cornetzi]|uniref:Zinc transporter ZIP2 n=1 Tax=Trachymyrmex cornetzi TaxID=471704 RepID=A0A195EG77_9HYME|nr:PREDICTED: protein zntB-like isoform X1 [Trachymyrmex cornetzi]KYN27265.1 Zinc transporter ZIP2 [Trachymyrmex cornetzi]